jgi:hypothetical protein
MVKPPSVSAGCEREERASELEAAASAKLWRDIEMHSLQIGIRSCQQNTATMR